jgi:flagellar protein FlgJ
MTLKQWLISRKLIKEAYKAKKITGLPASIVASQAILETGWLKYIPKDYITGETSNNLFGIKASSQPYVQCLTHEYIKGNYVEILAKFKKFKNYEESFIAYGDLINHSSRYRKAVAVKDDPRAYIREIWKAGYATDNLYPEKVLAVAENCGFIPKIMA